MARLAVPLLLGAVGAEADGLTLFQSSNTTGDKLTQKDDVQFIDDFDAQIVVDVSTSDLDQEITGFGGAFTEASGTVFARMPAEQQESLLEKYFDAEKGIGYTVGRVHINSCDFSPYPAQWSEDDVSGDFELKYFDYSLSHDSKAMIPLIKRGMAKIEESGRKLKLFASPWSPPWWMKNTSNMTGANNSALKADSKQVWADYIAKWIQAYKDQGIPLWGLTPQNEPENSAVWEACRYTAEEEADWIAEHLGPAMNASHPEVLIFPFDHNKDHVYEWAKVVFNHPVASQYVDGIALHWYTGDAFENVAKVHTEFPDKLILPTEATWEKYRWSEGVTAETGDWKMGEGYGHDIMGDLNNGAVGWTDWNLILDETGGPNHVGNNCDAPMFAANVTGEVYLHPQYYYIGHFSKFLVPGSKRIKSTLSGSTTFHGVSRGYGVCTSDDGLQATNWLRPDGQIAVVVMNCGGNAIDFKIKDNSRAAKANIPAHGIQTYLFKRGQDAETIVV